MNVTISGSLSTHAAYSFNAHNGGGEQLRTVPVGKADTVSITFSEPVNVAESDLRLVGLRTSNVPTVAEFVYDAITMTAIWRFIGVVTNDHYAISLSDVVTDATGYRLDGEWVNPISVTTTNSSVSEFPSGDGHAGGNFNFVFTLMSGDANLDNIVDQADVDIYAATVFDPAFDIGAYFIDGDFNGSGGVTFADAPLLTLNWLKDFSSATVLEDLNGDNLVDGTDLGTLLSHFGMTSPTHADGDVNGDGFINTADVDLMFAQYGLELDFVS